MNYLRNHQLFKRFTNALVFYKRRLYVFGAFSTFYATTLYKNRDNSSEIFRMALAGSLSNMFWEITFHFADTVNIRSKLHKQNVNTFHMLNTIFMEEGLYGLSKGISAWFYGSIVCGFLYFSLYKLFKTYLFKLNDGKVHSSLIFLTASFVAETFTLLLYYPYDLIKSRLQTSNRVYQYKSLLHAFQKEITENGLFSLYRGGAPFLIMFATTISLQFTVYESYIKFIKDHYMESWKNRELPHVVLASFLAGAVGSGATNGLEVLVVTKQTKPETNLWEIVKREKFGLMTKGLGARVYYQSIQSIVFFSTVTYVGKLFNVELED